MAIYHFTCQVISRGQGRSSVGATAYRSGSKLESEYDGMSFDYTYKGGIVYSEVSLPEHAPVRYYDRAVLWNEVERIEKSSKAQLAREYEMALPRELSREQQIELAREYVSFLVQNGMCADWAIHDKNDGNPHLHIMTTMRPIKMDGTWDAKQRKEYILDANGNKQYDPVKKTYKCRTVKTTDWDSKDFLQTCRVAWADHVNRSLEKNNIPERIDHRTLKEQGVEREPTIHEGVAARAMERRAEKKGEYFTADRCNINREVKHDQKALQTVKKERRDTNRLEQQIWVDGAWLSCHDTVSLARNLVEKTRRDATGQKALLRKLDEIQNTANYVADIQRQFKVHEDKYYYRSDEEPVSHLDFNLEVIQNDIAAIRRQIAENLDEIERQKQRKQQPVVAQEAPVPAADLPHKAAEKTAETAPAATQRVAAAQPNPRTGGRMTLEEAKREIAERRRAQEQSKQQGEKTQSKPRNGRRER